MTTARSFIHPPFSRVPAKTGIPRHLLLFLCTWCLTASAADLNTFEWDTSKGTHVVFYPAMNVPMLDISIAFAAGSAYDGEQFGLSALTTRLLNQGNDGLDANQVAEKLAETGAQYLADNNQDMVILNLKTLTEPHALKTATDLFATLVGKPDLKDEPFLHEKKQQLMSIVQAQESPDEVANQTFFQLLYKAHPYAHPLLGTKDTVNALSNEAVRHFYHQFFVAQNATLVLIGAISTDAAHQLAERVTAHLIRGAPPAPIPNAEPLKENVDIEVRFPSSQTMIRLGQLGITHTDQDYFPLMVGNYIVGGSSMMSQLTRELRENRGLTYGVYSQFSPMPGIGPFIISLSTKQKQTTLAINLIRATLSAFLKTGPTDQELLAAKQYLTGSFPLSLASNRSIADILIKMAFYHLPKDYLKRYVDHINAVTQADIKRAFQSRIHPDKMLQVTVGKPQQARTL